MIENKHCPKCDTVKPISEFRPRRDRKSGYESWCIPCFTAYRKERYLKNHDQEIKIRRRYYSTHKSEWIERTKEYIQNHLEAHKEYQRIYNNKRWQLMKANVRDLTEDEWMEIIDRQGNQCAGCGISFTITKPTLDHVFPLVKGGGATKSNVQALCRKCNSSKGAKTDWIYQSDKMVLSGS
jgi:5-methylcytosine-specific restriction endonuclease McrA